MSVAFRFMLLVLSLPSSALAQENVFDLHLSGKEVGKDTFVLAKSKQGYKVTGHLRGSIHNADLDFRDEFNYSDTYAYVGGSLTSQGNNQQISYLANKDYSEMTIAVAAAGHTSSNFEPIAPNLLFLPPFDAGAAQAVLLSAVTHPTPDNLYNVYLTPGYSLGQPGGGRPGAPPDPSAPPPTDTLPPGVHLFKALWAKGRDVTGTLDEKPVTLHTYQLAFGKFRWIFFADQDNNLMQVNVTLLHGSYIRAKFKLDPIAPTAPAASAPPKPESR